MDKMVLGDINLNPSSGLTYTNLLSMCIKDADMCNVFSVQLYFIFHITFCLVFFTINICVYQLSVPIKTAYDKQVAKKKRVILIHSFGCFSPLLIGLQFSDVQQHSTL